MEREAVCQLSWRKQAFHVGIDFHLPKWAESHTLVPTPLVLGEKKVRIFASFLDSFFVGRIGWIDLEYDDDFFKVQQVSEEPFLDTGAKGSFSEYGTGLGCFWPREKPEHISFVGFSRPPGYKFKAFSGLEKIENLSTFQKIADSESWLGGDTFGKTIVGLHDLIEIDRTIYGFVSLGDDFQIIDGRPFPRYQVGLLSGTDLENLILVSKNILPVPRDVYRMGRPRVELTNRGVEILVTVGTFDGRYFPMAFYSEDLKTWREESIESFCSVIVPNFDNLQQCYLSRFSLQNKEFIVYNGNDMGRYGFGIAAAHK